MTMHLAVDEGGSNIRVLVYNDSFLPLFSAQAGSIRTVTTEPTLVDAHLEDLMTQLAPLRGQRIGRISGVCSKPFLNRLAQQCSWEEVRPLGEGTIGFAAAGLFGDGMLALSGTGSTIFARKNGKNTTFGGYGPLVYDKGSGYHLGRDAFEAVIHSYAGIGEKTLLEPLLLDHLGYPDLGDAILSIYHINDQSPAATVAACAPLVAQAANRGDPVARNILIRGGQSLATQTVVLHRMAAMEDTCPITISGGTFKGHPLFYDSFQSSVTEALPNAQLVLPMVSPIVGAVFLHAHEQLGNAFFSQQQYLKTAYADYRFTLPQDRESEVFL